MVDVARRGAEAGDARVVADLEVQRVLRRAVGAGLEQQRVALRPELVRHLLRGDRVDGRLDLARRHARDRRRSTFGPKSGWPAGRLRGCGIADSEDEQGDDGCGGRVSRRVSDDDAVEAWTAHEDPLC